MRQTLREIWVSKKIFSILFLGFLLTIVPLQIASSTRHFYDGQFYHSKHGFFHYYYSINLTNITTIGLDKLEEIAQSAYEHSSVITSDINTVIPEIGFVRITGLLNDNWAPPLIKGENIHSDEADAIIAGKLVSSEMGTLEMLGKSYHVKGIAGLELGNEYNQNVYVHLQGMPDSVKQDIERQNTLKIVVRSNQNPKKEIDRFLTQLKTYNTEAAADVINEGPNYEKEKKSRQGVKEMLSYPYKLVLIGLINGINVSYLWIFLKRKEMSLRKALGASNVRLFQSIISQLFICAAAAALCSLLLQWLFSQLSLNIYRSTYYYISFRMSDFIFSILMTVAISLLTSIVPLLHIMKIQPAKALKE